MTESIESAVKADLKQLPEVIRGSGLAVAALTAARLLDDEPGARDFASLLKELRATMAELRDRAAVTPGQEDDPIDLITNAGPGQPGAVVPFRARGGRQQLG